MEGIVFGESPRWHDGRVWFSDWGAGQVIALDPGGGSEVIVSVASFPMCIDFLPDGRLLVVDSARQRVLRREPDGSMVTHADVASGRCVRVREGGEILAGVELDRGAFACTLSRGDEPRLYVVGQNWGGPQTAERTGQVVVFPAPAPGAGNRSQPRRCGQPRPGRGAGSCSPSNARASSAQTR